MQRKSFKCGPNTPPLVKRVLLSNGWNENSDDNSNWTLFWRLDRFTRSEVEFCSPFQRVNHIPKSSEITKKDNLQRNIRRMRSVCGPIYDFIPTTFALPTERVAFVNEFSSQAESTAWICKPRGLSRGRDIIVFNDLNDLKYTGHCVVQRYIEHPLLVAGYKHDLRLYVLVASLDPLTIMLYNDGFARFSTKKYNMDNLSDFYTHLTNCSINKENPMLMQENILHEKIGSSSAQDDFASTITDLLGVGAPPKWRVKQLRDHFLKQGIDDTDLWTRISHITILTILSIIPELPKNKSCFEMFGFDILVDENLRPWLLEVNFSPSLGCDCVPDELVKEPLVRDIIDTVCDENNNNNAEGFIQPKGGFELIFPFNETTQKLSHRDSLDSKAIIEEIKSIDPFVQLVKKNPALFKMPARTPVKTTPIPKVTKIPDTNSTTKLTEKPTPKQSPLKTPIKKSVPVQITPKRTVSKTPLKMTGVEIGFDLPLHPLSKEKQASKPIFSTK
eukprot:TRINITY_DN13454_c0_g1_i1.p1 TRINITY_DN13454_c0_g1~~TRINITY_DN13454_c0_g1_i1.p1  ORF type:complete len:539 (-),score=87.54 TRINITY_DN13454_c0_g1_i1:523-2028(-)